MDSRSRIYGLTGPAKGPELMPANGSVLIPAKGFVLIPAKGFVLIFSFLMSILYLINEIILTGDYIGLMGSGRAWGFISYV